MPGDEALVPEAVVRVLTWNLKWATRTSARGRALRQRIVAERPSIVCLTETYDDFLGDTGFTVTAGSDWGYPRPGGRRKVVLWSQRPFSSADVLGDEELPPGRFVAAVTETDLGPVHCLGVCVSWRDAHVRTGKANKSQWQDHVSFLHALQRVLEAPRGGPVLLLGDFNQTLPRSRAPEAVHRALSEAIEARLVIATAGLRAADGRLAIDHIAHSSELAATKEESLSSATEDGELSDHFGVFASLTEASVGARP